MINKKGFLKTILLIVIAIALLKLVWEIDVIEFLNRPQIKEIWDAVMDVFRAIWNFIKNLFSVFA